MRDEIDFIGKKQGKRADAYTEEKRFSPYAAAALGFLVCI